MRRDRLLLTEIVEAVERIIDLTNGHSLADFESDRDRAGDHYDDMHAAVAAGVLLKRCTGPGLAKRRKSAQIACIFLT